MGAEIEVVDKLKTKMDASTYKPNGIFAQELEDELMKFTANHEDCKGGAHLTEKTDAIHQKTDDEVNITESTKSDNTELVIAEYQDATDSSSSFDGSDSEVENSDTAVDSEDLSEFHGDAVSALECDRSIEMFRLRKKKLTDHWRTFIQPLMWRCKWVELQLRKFQSQAQKYDKKLEEYHQKKQIQLDNSTLEGLGAKSLPFSRQSTRSEVLQRKKRRRSEATMDIAAYMSHHNLFSYYENKKCFAEGAIIKDELRNPANANQKVDYDDEFWINEELLRLEPGDGYNSLEHILRKIEFLQAQVRKLKCRVNKVISENAGKFSCTDNLSLPMPCNAFFSSPRNSASPPNNGDRMPVGTYIASQLMSEYNMGNVKPESAVRSHGEVVPDVNGSRDHARFADDENGEEVLIDNQRVKEEMNNFEVVKPIQRPLVLKDALGSTVVAEPDPPRGDQPPPKMISISTLTAPKAKRKRANRKGAGR